MGRTITPMTPEQVADRLALVLRQVAGDVAGDGASNPSARSTDTAGIPANSTDDASAEPPEAPAGPPEALTEAPAEPPETPAEPAEVPPAEAPPSGIDDGREWRRAVLDVPRQLWPALTAAVRDDPELDLTFFDWLSGVDEQDAGFTIVTHLWSVRHRHAALLRTRVPREEPELASLVPVFPGAAWHERETFEMFGVAFAGHPDLRPLLLPDGFEGNPLRKDFVLASRVVREWPGAKEPGESHTGATRKRMRPPGVPDPDVWGPQLWDPEATADA